MHARVDLSAIQNLANVMAAAGAQVPTAAARALNHTVAKARTQMIRQVVGSTGLKYGTIRRALIVEKAKPGSLVAAVYSKGGDVGLKHFKARETAAGVSAAPRNHRQVFAGSFQKGGQFPTRVALRLGGHVYRRAGKGRLPLVKQKSGVFIPEDMVEGASEAAFYKVAQSDLPARLAHELYRVIG